MNFELDTAKPHTIKKFEIITEYTDAWARKILGFSKSQGLLYIDCMSNSGYYKDINNDIVEGTAVRVAERLNQISEKYPEKSVQLYFNDYEEEKIDYLEQALKSMNLNNIDLFFFKQDCSDFLKRFNLSKIQNKNILLIYDPFQADIRWDVLGKFLNSWGEVIINHMVSDTSRGAKLAKKEEKITKYETTYQMDISEIIRISENTDQLDNIVRGIIMESVKNNPREHYLASFPFFNRNNGLVYNLLHCTSNKEGFKLYKKTAWNVFGDKSSDKNRHGQEKQLSIDLDTGKLPITTNTDYKCYTISDIAKYIFEKYQETSKVDINIVYDDLDIHPVFPSDGYKDKVRKELRELYGVTVKKEKGINYFVFI